MFQLREINQMEKEMCQYLEWELNVDPGTLKEFEEMVRRLPGHWPIPDLHPPVDKEVDAAALCDPLPPHLRRQPLALKRTTLYVSAQGPLRPLPPVLYVATRDPNTILLDIIACIFCVAPYPCWYRGPLGQDRLGVVIARLPKAARAHSAASKQKQDVHIHIAVCGSTCTLICI